jgi:hypothetical protein
VITRQQAAVLEDTEPGIDEPTLVQRWGAKQVRACIYHFQWIRRGANEHLMLTTDGVEMLSAWRREVLATAMRLPVGVVFPP